MTSVTRRRPLPLLVPDELPAAAREVRRSYDIVQSIALALLDGHDRLRSSPITEVLVESFNIHLRALTDFFGRPVPNPRKPHCDDIVARHFDPDWDFDRDGLDSLIMLQGAMLGINKRTAHITAHRFRSPAGEDAQPIGELAGHVTALMFRLLYHLPPDRRRMFDQDGQPPDLRPVIFRMAGGIAMSPAELRLVNGVIEREQPAV